MISREDLLQPPRLDRLDEVDVESGVFAALPVGGLAVARERDEKELVSDVDHSDVGSPSATARVTALS